MKIVYELQITQTWHLKLLRKDGQTDGQTDERPDGWSGPTTRPAFDKAKQVEKKQICNAACSKYI